ncbi:hypothetical protein DPMN_026093 [Dreissena polymorpha]|uniref:HTH CENPB-type domain-containing protein n=1 Tax=Dreissena polymorpha TaxID=45954 RepID=A0A9D4RE85_DREPO|nr:hypothetical protein DPMN_026093 [Dreissena polymorpha]
MEEYECGNPEAKRVKVCMSYGKIDDLCYRWFLDATSRQINVSGPLIQKKAMKFASDLGLTEFKGSGGWLDSFKETQHCYQKAKWSTCLSER